MTNYQSPEQTPRKFLKTLSLLHAALLGAQILFAGVVLLLNSDRDIGTQASDNVFLYVVPVMSGMSFLLSRFLFSSLVAKARAKDSLKEILVAYQGAFLVRLALLEAPSLFAIVTYFVTGNIILLAVSGLIILYFLTLAPSKQKVESDLNLSYNHKLEFDKSDQIIQ